MVAKFTFVESKKKHVHFDPGEPLRGDLAFEPLPNQHSWSAPVRRSRGRSGRGEIVGLIAPSHTKLGINQSAVEECVAETHRDVINRFGPLGRRRRHSSRSEDNVVIA